MKKTLKWIYRILITLVILIVLLALSLKYLIDPNDYKEEIQANIEDTIGRQVSINGSIEWSLFPWLALTVKDVTVANEKGFKGDHIAEINQFSARVKILPLFTKDIEVGKVIISNSNFYLQVAKSGKSNWQSILDHMNETDSTTTETETSSGSLKIEGIDLSDISLSFTDAQADLKAILTKMNLSTSAISSEKDVTIDSSMHVHMPDTGLDLDLSTELQASHLLAESGAVFQLKEWDMKGVLSSESKMPMDVSLNGNAIINMAEDTLNFEELTLQLGEAIVRTNVQGSQLTGNMQLNGKYSVEAFDFNKFITQITGSPLVNNQVLADFQSSGQWLLKGQRLKLDDMVVSFDKSKIQGSADITDLDKMQGQFQVHINQFNVDDFLGDDSSSDSETASSGEMDFGRLTGSVDIDQLTASGTTMNNIKMKIQSNQSRMSIAPIRADFYSGSLQTQVLIDTKAEKDRIQVEHNMDKVQAGPLITDVMGSQLMTGLGHFDMDVKIDKPFSDLPLKTAHGKIDFSLGDGAIYGVDVFGMINEGLNLLYPEVMKAQNEGEKKTTFALMQFKASINEGILKTETLKMTSPYLVINGKITVNLFEQTIDGTIEPMLIDIPEQFVSDKYKKLMDLPIPVSLSGSLLEPKVKIDPAKLLLATQKQKIDKEKEKLKNKLLDSLFGNDKKDDDN